VRGGSLLACVCDLPLATADLESKAANDEMTILPRVKHQTLLDLDKMNLNLIFLYLVLPTDSHYASLGYLSSITSSTTSPFHLSTSVLSRSTLLEDCTMPKQPTKKGKAKGPHYRPKDTKKLQKASYQPALNSPPRPASATASSLSERTPPS
jgi:hypothetical protein